MTKNQNYWDKQNVFIDDIKLSFFDGQDADSLGRGFDEGHYPAAPLFKNSANYERLKEKYKDNIVYGQQRGGVFYISTNILCETVQFLFKQQDRSSDPCSI